MQYRHPPIKIKVLRSGQNILISTINNSPNNSALKIMSIVQCQKYKTQMFYGSVFRCSFYHIRFCTNAPTGSYDFIMSRIYL